MLKRSPLKRGTKPLNKISPRKLAKMQKVISTGSGMSLWSTWAAYQIGSLKPLQSSKTLKKTVLRKVTPKQSRRSRNITTLTHRAILESNNTCPKCGKQFSEINPASLDHIVQRGKGGTDDPENLRLLCLECHNKRHNGTKEEQHPENYGGKE